MPWYLTRLPRGRGTNAASLARNSIAWSGANRLPKVRIFLRTARRV